jgi:NADPH2:quinone reductase
MANTMKALQIAAFGGPEVMQVVELSRPEPATGQVLLRVEAAGLNYSDILIRQNQYVDRMALPYVLGREVCGVVEAVGEGVTDAQIGQRAVAIMDGGAMAEYAVTAARNLLPVPDGLTPEQAVAMLVQGVTALHCIDDAGQVQAGETVLVHSAAGGVGTLAVQMAAMRGATVFGTASSEEKRALVEELGATAIDYTQPYWVAELKKATGGRGADVILESVGGEIFLRSFRAALAPFGRMVVYGMASTKAVSLSNAEILSSGKTLVGYFMPLYFRHGRARRYAEAAAELARLVVAGELRVVIGGTFSLDEAGQAFELMANRESVGKVVVKP